MALERINMKTLLFTSSFLFSLSVFGDSMQFEFKNKYLESLNLDKNFYDIYCVHKGNKNFCSIETLYVKKTDIGTCEIHPTSWTSSSNFFEVTFNQSQKTFTVTTTLNSTRKKLPMYIISKEKLISYDEDGKFNVTILPKDRDVSLSCNDINFKTHHSLIK